MRSDKDRLTLIKQIFDEYVDFCLWYLRNSPKDKVKGSMLKEINCFLRDYREGRFDYLMTAMDDRLKNLEGEYEESLKLKH